MLARNLLVIMAIVMVIGITTTSSVDGEMINLTRGMVSMHDCIGNVSDNYGSYDGTANNMNYANGNACNFRPASNGHILVPDSADDPYDNIAEFTICLWMNATDRQYSTRVWHRSSIIQLYYEQQYEDEWRFLVDADSSTEVDDELGAGQNVYEEWVHYCLSWEAGNYTFHRDSEMYFSEDAGNSGLVDDSSVDLYIGIDEDANTREFQGQMKYINFWNRKLNSTEIYYVYHNETGDNIRATGLSEPDPCAYVSGDANFPCNCAVNTDIDFGGNSVTINGTGNFTIDGARLHNFDTLKIWGVDSTDICTVKVLDGGQIG